MNMYKPPRTKRTFPVILLLVFGVLFLWIIIPSVLVYVTSGPSAEGWTEPFAAWIATLKDLGMLGDAYGVANSLFTGFALAFIAYALIIQNKQYEIQLNQEKWDIVRLKMDILPLLIARAERRVNSLGVLQSELDTKSHAFFEELEKQRRHAQRQLELSKSQLGGHIKHWFAALRADALSEDCAAFSADDIANSDESSLAEQLISAPEPPDSYDQWQELERSKTWQNYLKWHSISEGGMDHAVPGYTSTRALRMALKLLDEIEGYYVDLEQSYKNAKETEV